MCSKIVCTLLRIACQRVYMIYDAIIYSKRPLLRLRHLPSNNELSAAKAHLEQLALNGIMFSLYDYVTWRLTVNPIPEQGMGRWVMGH